MRSLILSIILIQLWSVTAPPPPASDAEERQVKCVFDESMGYLFCSPVGHDGKNLGEILQETKVYSRADATHSNPAWYWYNSSAVPLGSAASVAPKVKELHLVIGGNFTITENCLKNFSNLEFFNTNLEVPPGGHWLNISPGAFRTKPKLNKIWLVQDFVLNEDSLLALESIKDQIIDFEMNGCQPGDGIVQMVSKFSKLLRVTLHLYRSAECRENMFQASASSLKSIMLHGCKPMDKLPKGMFKNLRNLQVLNMVYNNISSIEEGAFDDLVNLSRLYYTDNKTKYLPDGLFNKTENIVLINFSENSVDNLSERNFTEHKILRGLCLKEPRCC